MPSGGILDYAVYCNIIPQGGRAWCGLDVPEALFRRPCVPEALPCGGIRAQLGYQSGILLATYRLGASRFVLNTLRGRENLGTDPVGERLLLNYTWRELNKPPMELPLDFDKLLETIIYQP